MICIKNKRKIENKYGKRKAQKSRIKATTHIKSAQLHKQAERNIKCTTFAHIDFGKVRGEDQCTAVGQMHTHMHICMYV